MKLYLLRHGRTEANDKRLYCGFSDIPLSDNGKAHLKLLHKQASYPDITGLKVYTSGMRRTEETLEILYGQVPHQVISDFKELNFGDFEMKSYEELKNTPDYKRWLEDCNQNSLCPKGVCPNGESGEAMKSRAIRGLYQLMGQNEDCLVVCHGGIIASIMDELFPKENRNLYQWQPENGRGYLVTITNGIPERYESMPH
jgi:alpha-ribazole phosphatase